VTDITNFSQCVTITNGTLPGLDSVFTAKTNVVVDSGLPAPSAGQQRRDPGEFGGNMREIFAEPVLPKESRLVMIEDAPQTLGGTPRPLDRRSPRKPTDVAR
jgi:hypothetical protein